MLHHLGALLMREGSFDDAAAALTRAIELAPKMASHRVLLSRILARKGKLEAAIASFLSALQIDPALAAAMTLQNELERGYPAREAVTTRSSARVGTAARAQDGGP
jgi:tetratricopeptide (TPR) repeat protein